jgi:hypothetical protein
VPSSSQNTPLHITTPGVTSGRESSHPTPTSAAPKSAVSASHKKKKPVDRDEDEDGKSGREPREQVQKLTQLTRPCLMSWIRVEF